MSVMQSPPSAVLFDFFDTLVEVDRDAPSMAQLLTELGYDCPPELEAVWNSLGFDGLVTPEAARGAYQRWRLRNLAYLVSMAGVPSQRESEVVELLLKNDRSWTVRARPGAHTVLDLLAASGIPHGILSNWDYPLGPYLRQAGFDPKLNHVTSAQLGVRKPAVEFFESAFHRLGLRLSQSTWYVGDNWTTDVVGALRAGLHPVLISPHPAANPLPRHVGQYASLSHLAKILDDLVR